MAIDALTKKVDIQYDRYTMYNSELDTWFKCLRMDHVKQESNWDCGISCIEMVLSSDKLTYFKIHKKTVIGLQDENCHSIWTIDLAYILKKLDVSFKYCTSCFGISPELYKHSFYEHILSKDYHRLLRKFHSAKENKILIYKDIIPTSELIKHLKENGPIIVLTDAKWLQCIVCFKNIHPINNIRQNLVNFQGHYVVVTGYNLSKNYITYLDPSCAHKDDYTTYYFTKKAHV